MINLIGANAGFESSGFWNAPAIDTTIFRTGAKSCKCNTTYSSGSVTGQRYLNSGTNYIYPKAGEIYTFSAYVYIPVGSPITTMGIDFRNADWSNGSGQKRFSLTAGQWTRIHVTFKAVTASESGWRLIVADPAAPGYTGTTYWYVDDTSVEISTPTVQFRPAEI